MSNAIITRLFPQSLAADTYDGTVAGVVLHWTPSAITTLEKNAPNLRMDVATLKAATEHISHESAKRREKTRVRIRCTFHDTTTVTETREKKPDFSHCTLGMSPDNHKIHIYVEFAYTAGSDQKVDGYTITRESVVTGKGKKPESDPSFGDEGEK